MFFRQQGYPRWLRRLWRTRTGREEIRETDRYHLSQYEKPYESTEALDRFIREVHPEPMAGTLMDVGCGAGAVIHYLRSVGTINGCRILGIDSDRSLLKIAQERNPSDWFMHLDFLYPLPICDYSLSVQVLSFIENWETAITELLNATRRMCFVTSLFWDGVSSHVHATDREKRGVHYNVIDREGFQERVEVLGGQIVKWQRYEPKRMLASPENELRSRTVGTMTFSGPLLLPWWLVAVAKRA